MRSELKHNLISLFIYNSSYYNLSKIEKYWLKLKVSESWILNIKHFWNGNNQSFLNLRLTYGLRKGKGHYFLKSLFFSNIVRIGKIRGGGGKSASVFEDIAIICEAWTHIKGHNYLPSVHKFTSLLMEKPLFNMWIIIFLSGQSNDY